MRADRRGGGGAFLRLDQPGVGEDQPIEPRFVAMERQRGGTVAKAKADHLSQPWNLPAEGVGSGLEVRPASLEAGIRALAVANPAPVVAKAGITFIDQCLGESFIHPM